MQLVAPKHLAPKITVRTLQYIYIYIYTLCYRFLRKTLYIYIYIYMMFSLRSDSRVYTHVNLAPCSCVHRKMQDCSTASPIGSKSLPRRTMSLKADSVLTRYSFQSQRRHQGVWGRRRFNQTVVVIFACVWRLSLSPERPRRHPEVALRTLLPVPSGSGYDLQPKHLWGGGEQSVAFRTSFYVVLFITFEYVWLNRGG